VKKSLSTPAVEALHLE